MLHDLSNGKKNLLNEIEFLKLDISKENQIKKLPKEIDYIFHLAGQSLVKKVLKTPKMILKEISLLLTT